MATTKKAEKKRYKSDKERKVSLTLSVTLDTANKARSKFGTLGKAVYFAVTGQYEK